MKMDKKYFPKAYLEECKYKVKKIKMSKFTNAELESDSDSDSDADLDSESEYDTLMGKLKSDSDLNKIP